MEPVGTVKVFIVCGETEPEILLVAVELDEYENDPGMMRTTSSGIEYSDRPVNEILAVFNNEFQSWDSSSSSQAAEVKYLIC